MNALAGVYIASAIVLIGTFVLDMDNHDKRSARLTTLAVVGFFTVYFALGWVMS